MRRPAVLVIAGTDSSGGAGLTRDVATLAHCGVEARCVVTAVTAQSHQCVAAIHPVPGEMILAQLKAALEAGPVGAVKIGMLGTAEAVQAVAEGLPSDAPVVLDPVLVSSSGGVLLDAQGQEALRGLLPRVSLLTPNIPEAAALLGEALVQDEECLVAQARRLQALGAAAVLLKGGHGSGPEAVDYLVEEEVVAFRGPRLVASQRGTGCSLATAVAAGLACREDLRTSCERARAHVRERLLGRV